VEIQASAFVGSNPTGELITSGLLVIREQLEFGRSSNRSHFQIAPAHRPVGATSKIASVLQGGRQGTNLPKQAHPVLHMTRHGDSSFLKDVEFKCSHLFALLQQMPRGGAPNFSSNAQD
jgi:hypothetical protein